MMYYPLRERELRVKTDVIDLKLDRLFWRRVFGKTIFRMFVELIHAQQFRGCVARHRGNYKVKAFSSAAALAADYLRYLRQKIAQFESRAELTNSSQN
jgi:hypothetical protein